MPMTDNATSAGRNANEDVAFGLEDLPHGPDVEDTSEIESEEPPADETSTTASDGTESEANAAPEEGETADGADGDETAPESAEAEAGDDETAPADAETESDEEADRQDKAAEFDPTEFGLDAEKFKHCSSVEEALKLKVEQDRHLQALMNRQAQELGLLRRWYAQQGTQGDAEEGAEKATSDTDGQPPSSWTDEQRRAFIEKFEEAPDAALAEVMAAERQAVMEAMERRLAEIREEPRRAEMDREYREFVKAHPDAAAGTPKAKQLYEVGLELGVDCRVDDTYPLETLYRLTEVKERDAGQYQSMVDLMARGLSYDEAEEFLDLRRQRQEWNRSAGERAAERVRKTSGIARKPMTTPAKTDPEITAFGIDELED